MITINTIKRYDVQYGKQYKFNPYLLSRIIDDFQDESGIDVQTFGDSNFEESGLYEFEYDAFREMGFWLEKQSDSYFEHLECIAMLPVEFKNIQDFRNWVYDVIANIQEANPGDEVVRIEIWR